MNPYFKAIPAGEVQEPLETQKVWTVPACRASATRHVFCFTLCPLPHIEQIKSSSWREKHSCTGTEERARVWAILPPRGCWPSSHSPSSTHCPHSAAIWPAGKSEPPETRPNTWCSLTTRAFLLIVKGWIKIIQAHKVHGRTTFKKKKKATPFTTVKLGRHLGRCWKRCDTTHMNKTWYCEKGKSTHTTWPKVYRHPATTQTIFWNHDTQHYFSCDNPDLIPFKCWVEPENYPVSMWFS